MMQQQTAQTGQVAQDASRLRAATNSTEQLATILGNAVENLHALRQGLSPTPPAPTVQGKPQSAGVPVAIVGVLDDLDGYLRIGHGHAIDIRDLISELRQLIGR